MKSRFVDPFTPNRPIDDPERFFGRVESVSELVDSLFQIKNRNPKHTIITGDRGVGKSSLLIQISLTAEGDNRLTDTLKEALNKTVRFPLTRVASGSARHFRG